MDIRDLVPEYVLQNTPYQPGKPIEELERELGITDCIKLASNENPVGPSPKAVEAMEKAIRQANFYPDGGCFYLKNALSKKYGVPPSQIVVGNGSNEVIEIFMRTVLTPADDVVISQYSFIVYKLIAQAMGVKAVFVPAKEDYSHDLDAMADAITERTKIVFVDNPNNPTGTLVQREAFDKFMQRVPERVVVVADEAYDDYVDPTIFPDSLHYLKAGRRIVILKTFAKIYGLSGLRLGYGFAPDELVDAMNRVRQPFNVNAIAQAAGLAALSDDGHVRKSREINEKGKAYLYKAFDEMGISYFPTYGNFMTIDTGQDAGPVYEALLQLGVIVRPVKGYGLPNHLRMTIGTAEQNTRLVESLKKVLKR
jgi:histidinol-phosphate aminotransferase